MSWVGMMRAWLSGRWMVRAYLLCLHVFCALLVFKTNFLPLLGNRLGLSRPDNSAYLADMVSYQTRADMHVPPGVTVFLGDSLTQGLATVAVLPHAVNYGIGGQTTQQMIDALPLYASLKHAHAVVLMIGINDLLRGRVEGLEARFQQILHQLPSGVPLYWHGLMPARSGRVTLPDVQRINERIQALCAARPLCTYVDTWAWMVDGEGQMRAELYSQDLLHLSPEGYRSWIARLREVLSSDQPAASAAAP